MSMVKLNESAPKDRNMKQAKVAATLEPKGDERKMVGF